MNDENIEWLENKISTLETWKNTHPHTKEMENEIRMLKNILYAYKHYKKESSELSWIQNPDQMGQ